MIRNGVGNWRSQCVVDLAMLLCAANERGEVRWIWAAQRIMQADEPAALFHILLERRFLLVTEVRSVALIDYDYVSLLESAHRRRVECAIDHRAMLRENLAPISQKLRIVMLAGLVRLEPGPDVNVHAIWILVPRERCLQLRRGYIGSLRGGREQDGRDKQDESMHGENPVRQPAIPAGLPLALIEGAKRSSETTAQIHVSAGAVNPLSAMCRFTCKPICVFQSGELFEAESEFVVFAVLEEFFPGHFRFSEPRHASKHATERSLDPFGDLVVGGSGHDAGDERPFFFTVGMCQVVSEVAVGRELSRTGSGRFG